MCATFPAHFILLHHPNNIWWRAQVVKLLIMHLQYWKRLVISIFCCLSTWVLFYTCILTDQPFNCWFGKCKVKLSLCLFLNRVPGHEGVLGE
jgi:hypothetical protein